MKISPIDMRPDKKSWRKYGLWALGIYIISLLISFPANTAYRFWKETIFPITLTQITGTVWNGKAEQISIDDYDLYGFQWAIQPLKLVTGNLAYNINLQDNNFHLRGNISRTITGEFTGNDINGQLPVDVISRFGNIPLFGIQGNLQFRLEEIEISNHVIGQATGKITLHNGSIKLPGETPIGTIYADITSKDNTVILAIKDKKAPIGITGTLILKPDRSYQFSAQLQPGPSANFALLTMLKEFGNLRQDGSISIRYSGSY